MIPRSRDRGPVEDFPGGAPRKTTPPIPRSRDRGPVEELNSSSHSSGIDRRFRAHVRAPPVEASHPRPSASICGWIPRSRERPPLEPVGQAGRAALLFDCVLKSL